MAFLTPNLGSSMLGSAVRLTRNSGGNVRSQCRKPKYVAAATPGFDPSEHASIFEMQPSRGHITIWDARDARDACSILGDRDARQACYAQFGCDQRRVDMYFSTVYTLEHQMAKGEDSNCDGDDFFEESERDQWSPFNWRFG